ncbi:MAG: hypothetical protein ACE5JL_09985, partial [Dehalococcoidia bacterium]
MITGTGRKRVSLGILAFVGLVLLLAAGGAATFSVTNTSDSGQELSESRVSARNIGNQASPNVDFLANVLRGVDGAMGNQASPNVDFLANVLRGVDGAMG